MVGSAMLFSRTKSFRWIPNRSAIAISVSPRTTVYVSRNSLISGVVSLVSAEGDVLTTGSGALADVHPKAHIVNRDSDAKWRNVSINLSRSFRQKGAE